MPRLHEAGRGSGHVRRAEGCPASRSADARRRFSKSTMGYQARAPRTWEVILSSGHVDVLAAIGNTPLVQLRRVVPRGAARVFAKLESANPTGSMKDRMAKAAIEAAEADGRLAKGGTVVEYTAGTTGISLAFVSAAKGYGIEIVFSDAFSGEKGRTMRAF